jgi:SPP1 gp7 family putative phage head morphogenesis protein
VKLDAAHRAALLLAVDRYLEADNRRMMEAAKARKLGLLDATDPAWVAEIGVAIRAEGREFLRELRSLEEVWPPERKPGRLREAVPPPDWGPIWDRVWLRYRARHLEIFRRRGHQAIELGTASALAELGVGAALNLPNPRAVEWLRQHGAELVTKIGETTRARIREVLVRALDSGLSYQKSATAIRTLYSSMSGYRAKMIAVTENAFAYEHGNRLAADQLRHSGVPMEKFWLTVGDDRVDPPLCEENELEGWIPLSEHFQSGDEQPPAHPNCRCTALYRQAGTRG